MVWHGSRCCGCLLYYTYDHCTCGTLVGLALGKICPDWLVTMQWIPDRMILEHSWQEALQLLGLKGYYIHTVIEFVICNTIQKEFVAL